MELLPSDPAARYRLHGVFATLSPCNAEACRHLDYLITVIESHPTRFGKQGRYVFLLSQEKRPLREVLQDNVRSRDPTPQPQSPHQWGGASFSSDGTVPDEDCLDDLVWHGCFVFSLQIPPQRPRLGWAIGYGPINVAEFEPQPNDPDISLAIGQDSRSLKLHNRSAMFSFKSNLGLLSVACPDRPNPDLLINGISPKPMAFTPLSSVSTHVTVGKLAFSFCFVDTAGFQETWKSNLEKYLRDRTGRTEPLSPVAQTPSKDDFIIGDWRFFSRSVGAGASGRVFAALHSNGTAGAVKTEMLLNSEQRQRLSRKVQKLTEVRELLGQSSLIQKFHGSYDHPDRLQAYLVFTPLVLGDLQSFLHQQARQESPLSSQTTLRAIASQLLQAVAALHLVGFMHGDIKSRNLGLLKLSPPHLVVLDLDDIYDLRNSKDMLRPRTPGVGGTVGYHSPERESDEGGQYAGLPADMWSVGCVLLDLFRRTMFVNTNFNPFKLRRLLRQSSEEIGTEQKRYWDIRQTLCERPMDSVENLIARLLDPMPQLRLTAEDALRHPSLAISPDAHLNEGSSSKKLRIENQRSD